jgi:hypothetical protein
MKTVALDISAYISLFKYGLFDNFSRPDYVISHMMISELEKMWKEAPIS